MTNTSQIQIHFEGDITENHQIPMRILGHCLLYTQKAFDRAYLDLKYQNGIYKYARMGEDDYVKTEFWVESPEEGGYIAKFFSRDKDAPKTADRVSSAINQALDDTIEIKIPINTQIENRKTQVSNNIINLQEYKELIESESSEVKRKYGDRSIAKEIDQVLTTIRKKHSGDSQLSISITGTSTQEFNFNKASSQKFHEAVSSKKVGPPTIYKGKIHSLDKKNLTGKFENNFNQRSSLLHMNSEADLLKVHPYLGNIGDIQFVGCPKIEFGSIEPYSGDIYFLYPLDEVKTKDTVGDILIK